MNISEAINHLEKWAPPSLQEPYDNSRLIVGNTDDEIKGILVCLDSTEAVIEEAISRGCNLVIAHHPIVFSGLKSITGKNYIERTILKAIKNDIAIYAIHTNLDNIHNGVNQKIAEKIGLLNTKILVPKTSLLEKLVFYCPTDQAEFVRNSIFKVGAGKIGNYDNCSFNSNGKGTFKANDSSTPFAGKVGELHEENEVRIETVLPLFKKQQVLSALIKSHPYEEVAYDFYPISNDWNQVGSGLIGDLETAIETNSFLQLLKEQLNTNCIRHTQSIKEKVKRVAVCGGSGSTFLKQAITQRADIFITADFKYHQFFDADGKIVIADVGHYESEQFTPELIQVFLQEKIPNFAVHLTKINTNPINYK